MVAFPCWFLNGRDEARAALRFRRAETFFFFFLTRHAAGFVFVFVFVFVFAAEEFRASQRLPLRSHVFSPVTSPRPGRFDRHNHRLAAAVS
jgi:hypothetical protein